MSVWMKTMWKTAGSGIEQGSQQNSIRVTRHHTGGDKSEEKILTATDDASSPGVLVPVPTLPFEVLEVFLEPLNRGPIGLTLSASPPPLIGNPTPGPKLQELL